MVYDPRLGDTSLHKLLVERARSGVDVRIIGGFDGKRRRSRWSVTPGDAYIVRAIVRDSDRAFIVSQSHARLELDGRGEMGVVVRSPRVVRAIQAVFQEDWILAVGASLDAAKPYRIA